MHDEFRQRDLETRCRFATDVAENKRGGSLMGHAVVQTREVMGGLMFTANLSNSLNAGVCCKSAP